MVQVTRHYVMRTHSGPTVNNVLWKVMTRGIKDKRDAESWLEFCASEEKNKKHEFFIVTRTEEEVE